MSGLAAGEVPLPPGTVQTRLGKGRTAEVLRNLCHALRLADDPSRWQELVDRAKHLFDVTIAASVFVAERGELMMAYTDRHGLRLDISASGRLLQQTVLVMESLLANPGAVL